MVAVARAGIVALVYGYPHAMAYVPTSHRYHGGGSEIPTPYAVAYLVVALLVWFGVSAAMAIRTARDEHRGDGPAPAPDGEQIVMGLVIGACAALVWPATLIAAAMWWGIRRLTRPTPPPRRIGGPPNPSNGHGWECNCGPCAIFWDTAEGERAYRQGFNK